MVPQRVLAALETGQMISMATGRIGRRTPRDRRVRHRQVVRPTPCRRRRRRRRCARASTGDSRIPTAGAAWNGWGVNTSNTRFQDAATAGSHRRRCPAAETEMGVRLPRRSAVERAADARRRARVRRQRGRHGVLAQRRDRLRPLVLRCRRPRARGRSASAGSTLAADALRGVLRRRRRRTSTRSMRRPGKLLWKTKVDDFPVGADHAARRRFHNGRLYVPVRVGRRRRRRASPTTSAASSAAASSRSTPRPASRSGRRYTIAEEPMPTHEEQGRHAALGAVRCAGLEQPGDRRRAQRALRHHRQQLQRSADADMSDAFVALDLDVGKDSVVASR